MTQHSINESPSISQHTKSLRTDLLIAADSLTSAMSSLVQQLNTESSESLPNAVDNSLNLQIQNETKSTKETKTNHHEQHSHTKISNSNGTATTTTNNNNDIIGNDSGSRTDEESLLTSDDAGGGAHAIKSHSLSLTKRK